ncbi:MAG: DNA mismatch repair protein MutT [Desulfobacterales bacterium]|nr:MAG: DNA mismatch repair protein MutT [Desulfobacterales bacterium]
MKNPNTHTFKYCPACGAHALAPDNAKSFSCRFCHFKFFINTAAAAMALITDEQDRLLVTRRKRDPEKGSLDLPGGFAEPGEDIERCLIREIKEELNLDVTDLTYFGSFSNIYPYKSVFYPITDLAFICQVDNFKEIRPMDDVAQFMFIPIDELQPSKFGMDSARNTVVDFIKAMH